MEPAQRPDTSSVFEMIDASRDFQGTEPQVLSKRRCGVKLKVVPFALSSGIMAGIVLLALTLLSHATGAGAHMMLMSKFCPGYSVSAVGSILGLIYGFVYGFIGAAIFASLYNSFGKFSR